MKLRPPKSFLRRAALGLAAFLAAAFVAEAMYRALLFSKARFYSPEGGGFELYVIGGSVAQGYPYGSQEMSFAGIVRDMFHGDLGGKRIEVRLVKAPRNLVYIDFLALRTAAAFRDRAIPGAVLIYPTNSRPDPSSTHSALDWLHEKVLIHSYLASDAFWKAENLYGAPGIGDMRTFEFYLRRIIETSRSAGLTPILSTETGNVGGLEPQLKVGGGLIQQSGVIPLVQAGVRSEDRGRYKEAAGYYAYLLRRFPLFGPMLEFRIGRCDEALHDYAAARARYWRVFDQDSSIARANDAIRRVAKEYRVPLIDAEDLFQGGAPDGPPRRTLFLDSGHLSTEGQILLARAFAGKLSASFGEPLKPVAIDPEILSRRASLSRSQQACSLVVAGVDVLRTFNWYPDVRLRLDIAGANFGRATVLDPDLYSAWAGLGAVSAARGEDFTINGLRIAGLHLDARELSCVPSCLSREEADRFASDISKHGADPSILEPLARTVGRIPACPSGGPLGELNRHISRNVSRARSTLWNSVVGAWHKFRGGTPPPIEIPSDDRMKSLLQDYKGYRGVLSFLKPLAGEFPGDGVLWLDAAEAALGAGDRREAQRCLAAAGRLELRNEDRRRLEGLSARSAAASPATAAR